MLRLHAASITIALLSILGGSAMAAGEEPTTLNCENGATHDVDYGTLANNQWNRALAGPGPWQQCLLSRQREGRTEYGWSWRWPSRDGLYAYPELLVGRSPWLGVPSNDKRFPRRIADTQSLWIDYDIESSYRGKRNLAADVWLTDSLPAVDQPDAQSIRAELMIWTDASAGLIPPEDKPAAVVEIDGRKWTLYVQHDRGEGLPGVTRKWTLISYHATASTLTIRYDMRKFLRDAVGRGLIQDSDFIPGVELGNEISSGSGFTWIKKFNVEVE